MKLIIAPRIAARRQGNDFYCRSCWRQFPMVNKLQEIIRDNSCGELRSLRFTANRPQKNRGTEEVFIYDRFGSMLDAAEVLAGALTQQLYLEKAAGANVIFALAQFANGIVAEFECNEELPDTMPDIAFVKGNFSEGHATNQPLVGYFNQEGLIVANAQELRHEVVEKSGKILAHSPFEWMKLRFEDAVSCHEIPPGNLGFDRIISLIQGALQ